MTLEQYLNTNEVDQNISILMFDNANKLMLPMEYSPNQFRRINKELLKKEFMEEQQEEDCLEIWVM